ncbi:transposase [Streptomyces sp. NPDC006335]|uniref:transposase n=1 Tax=Streptomyces sp. NPDC006335 TaxID=3156895 RepID=UPI0033A6C239
MGWVDGSRSRAGRTFVWCGDHGLTDAHWRKIESLFAWERRAWRAVGRALEGRQRVLFRARTGLPWPDLPERYGPWQTVYERHRRWSADGTWQSIL